MDNFKRFRWDEIESGNGVGWARSTQVAEVPGGRLIKVVEDRTNNDEVPSVAVSIVFVPNLTGEEK